MGAQVRRGELPMPDDDDAALKYEVADDVLTSAGLSWYEVSNFARTPEHACRHNLAYWRGADSGLARHGQVSSIAPFHEVLSVGWQPGKLCTSHGQRWDLR